MVKVELPCFADLVFFGALLTTDLLLVGIGVVRWLFALTHCLWRRWFKFSPCSNLRLLFWVFAK